jgi:hypothetical protein
MSARSLYTSPRPDGICDFSGFREDYGPYVQDPFCARNRVGDELATIRVERALASIADLLAIAVQTKKEIIFE